MSHGVSRFPVVPRLLGFLVLMDSGSGITDTSEELVEALQGQSGMIQTALTQAFVGHTRVVMSLGQECDIETQWCPLYLTIEIHGNQSGLLCRYRAPCRYRVPWGGDVVIVAGRKR